MSAGQETPVADDAESRVAAALADLPQLAGNAEELVVRGRFVTLDCLVGTVLNPVRLSILEGRVVAARSGPSLMIPWRFAIRATPEAWLALWRSVPPPGWHDLLSLTKRGAASVEGDLHPFMANLQYFKDLLALPRGRAEGARP